MAQTEIAKSGQIREGAVYVTTAGGHSIAATRVNGAVQVFENKCPHLGLSLAKGKIANGTITCPFHGSKFDICSGRNLDWVTGVMGTKTPEWTRVIIALGKKPAGLKTFPASEGEGSVFVDIR
jgi:nitrite reductase/ring-hydroxylating ferredoxin subunit